MIQLVQLLAAGVRDDSDRPLSFGRVYVYEAGTTKLATAWKDRNHRQPHSNPVQLDIGGRALVWAENRVKLVIEDLNQSPIRTIDQVGLSDADTVAAQIGNLAGPGLVSTIDDKLAALVDAETITILNNMLRVPNQGIGTAQLRDLAVTDGKIAASAVTADKIQNDAVVTAKLPDGAVTRPKISALGQQISSSSGTFSTTSSSAVDVTNLSVTLTTTGRPVYVGLIPDGSSDFANIAGADSSATVMSAFFRILRGTDEVCKAHLGVNSLFSATPQSCGVIVPPGVLQTIDTPSAGTHTYKVQANRFGSNTTASVNYCKLIAFEL